MGGNVNSSGAFGTGLFVLFGLYFVVIIGCLVTTIVAIVDIAKRPEWQWKLAGQEKILWLLLVILVNFLAIPALIYWFKIRKKLINVERAAAAGQYGPGHATYAGWEPTPPAPVPPPGMPPCGWHPDPSGQPQLRWWDGTRWSEYTWSSEAPTP